MDRGAQVVGQDQCARDEAMQPLTYTKKHGILLVSSMCITCVYI